MDQRLHRRQKQRRAEPADDGPEHDDRRQSLGQRHRQGTERVAQQAEHEGPLPPDEVAHLAPDQDERRRNQRLERDGALHPADGRVEIFDDFRDRHVHQRRVDDEHEHRHRQQHGEAPLTPCELRLVGAHYAWLSVRVGGQPGLRVFQVADREALGLARQQERQRAQRRAHPVLVADHGHTIERRGVSRAEPRIGLHGVALDLARRRAQQVEEAHLAPFGHLSAKHRLDSVLPVLVLDLTDRFESERSGGHVPHLAQHDHRLQRLRWSGDTATEPPSGHHSIGVMFDSRAPSGPRRRWPR